MFLQVDAQKREGSCFRDWIYAALAHVRKHIRGFSNHTVSVHEHNVSAGGADGLRHSFIFLINVATSYTKHVLVSRPDPADNTLPTGSDEALTFS